MKIKHLLFTISLGLTVFCNAQVDSTGVRSLQQEQMYTSSLNDEARKDYEMGHKYFDQGDLRNSIKYYIMAIKLDSGFVDAYDNCGISYRHLAGVYSEHKDDKMAGIYLDSAIWCYKKSIKKFPKGRLAHMNMAVALSMENKMDAALDEYQTLENLNPNDPEAYYGKAHIYLLTNNPDKALPEAQQALKLYQKYSPDLCGDAEAQIGICYYSMGDKKNAKKYLEKAKKDGTNIPPRLADDLNIK